MNGSMIASFGDSLFLLYKERWQPLHLKYNPLLLSILIIYVKCSFYTLNWRRGIEPEVMNKSLNRVPFFRENSTLDCARRDLITMFHLFIN